MEGDRMADERYINRDQQKLTPFFTSPLPPPASTGGRCTLAAQAAPSARCGSLRKRRAARQGTAERGLDMPLRMG